MTLPLFERPLIVPGKTPNLRPYQEKAIALAGLHVSNGKKHVLVCAPCGSGKMLVIATIIRKSTVPCMFVAHRQELIEQCSEQLARQGITNIGVIRADDKRTNPSASVQIASIQTLIRRDKPPAGLIFIDECHRSASDSYLDHVFGAYQNAVILGFTASPCRNDGRPLGAIYEELIIAATYSELLKHPDWLAEPDGFSAPIVADLSSVPKTQGDFEETALGEVMSQHVLVGNILSHWLKLSGRHPVVRGKQIVPGAFTDGPRRRTFIFAVNIKHSQLICERFEKSGIKIAHLDGKTPETERRSMLKAVRKGELECVSNCNVLLEGVDAPEVKCVVHARPTFSLVLWLQSATRNMRPWNNVRPLLLDHAGNWDRHGPPHEDRNWSLSAVASRKSNAPPTKICKQCFAYVSLGLSLCPYCKYAFTQAEMRPHIPTESNVELVMRNAAPEVARKEFFDRMAVMARVKGYKPGFASAKHLEQYKFWPPREWSDVVKAVFASDPQWQASVAKREGRKKKEEDAWDEPAEIKVEPPSNDDGETFGDWIDGEVGR